ncbi:MAG: type II toxin-antitoxin system VapC family toxin [Thaumarchaeota archaeon]|nr:type II toxin-antitoxin system VapC family toxin [Nitrososphaerota archaeon]
MRYTVDASVLVKLLVDEQYSQEAVKIVSDPKTVLYAPDIVYHEIGSVLYKMARRGIIGKNYAVQAYERIIRLPIDVSTDLKALPEILGMSLRLGLHFYDCLYIHTARKTDSTLISSDRRLLTAAGKECNSRHLESA